MLGEEFIVNVFLPTLLDGLVNGAALGLVALGLSVIFGITGVINFAHGDLYMLASYFGVIMLFMVIPNFLMAAVVAVAALAVLGLGVERAILRPLYGRGPVHVLVATFGLALFLREFIRTIWGAEPIMIAPPIPGHIIFGPLHYPIYRVIVLIAAMALYLFLWYFFNRTTHGAIIRAAAENKQMLSCVGVDVQKVYTFTFVLAMVLAAAGGMITLPLASLSPEVGAILILMCFYIIVIGGMGSIGGTVITAFIIGEAIALGSIWLGPREMEIFIFLIMIIVLALRPRGLFGKPLLLE